MYMQVSIHKLVNKCDTVIQISLQMKAKPNSQHLLYDRPT